MRSDLVGYHTQNLSTKQSSVTSDHLLWHALTSPQNLGSAKHSVIMVYPSNRNSHLTDKHAGKRANVRKKPSFYILRRKHSNPPHPTLSQLQPLHPSPARAKTSFHGLPGWALALREGVIYPSPPHQEVGLLL